LEERGIYTDLLRALVSKGHEVIAVTPVERRDNKKGHVNKQERFTNIHVKTLNIQKTGIIEKTMGMLTIATQFKRAIKKQQPDATFDLILYSTPPITLYPLIKWLKKSMDCKTYMLLKDIFPQNAVDMGMIRKNSAIHSYFSRMEKKLYNLSDYIGTMSPANTQFLLAHHSYLNPEKIYENPNSIEPQFNVLAVKEKQAIREKYSLPLNKRILVYGGNLGIPQGIDFLIEVLDKVQVPNCFFLIVGSGSEFSKLKVWFDKINPLNAMLIAGLPKAEYDSLLQSCDVGLIFLHKDFLIPNFPSRLLSYLEMGFPIITATDTNTDIGKIVEDSKCGIALQAGNIDAFEKAVQAIVNDNLIYGEMAINAKKLLLSRYTVDKSVQIIENQVMLQK
jgi:glycosyltransferase involved in cell wall biosynthesis